MNDDGWAPDDGKPRPADALEYFATLVNDGRTAARSATARYSPTYSAGCLSGQRAGASATCSPASSGSPWARNTTPEWLDDTVKGAPDGPAAFREGDGSGPGYPDGAHYRNCWWVTNPGLPLYNAAGIYGQSIFVHGPGQVVVAKLSSWPDALSAPMRRATVAAVHAIASALPDTCS